MIIFKKVKYRNLLSTGNVFTEIPLNQSSNTLIIGANGSGKSTILDALCFVLFGKPFRRINKPGLLNSINQADCSVEIEFTIGRKNYRVVRGIKPNVFEIWCNGVMLNQDSKIKDYQEYLEKTILKLNLKTFTQVVILGSASFVPFMQLSPADRRNIIEDLLDIQIFSSMNVILKNTLSIIKDNMSTVLFDIKLTGEKIEIQKQNIEEHKKSNESQITKKENTIKENENHCERITNDIKIINDHIQAMQNSIENRENVYQKQQKILQLSQKLDANKIKLNRELEFYKNNDSCPVCQQHIELSFKDIQLKTKQVKHKETDEALVKLKTQNLLLETALKEYAKVIENISKHSSEIVKHNASMLAIKQYIATTRTEIEELKTSHNNIITDNVRLKQLKSELSILLKSQKILIEDKYYHEFVFNLLKDSGIKTKIIKQYLPIMNKLINKYLTSLDFFVNFNIDENFQETIKSRHRDNFTYDSFSEGEKMRIDLSLLLTWRQIAKMKNSTNTNLLILDEIVDSSLDVIGIDNFLKIMGDMDKDTNVFIISHKGDQLFDKFDEVIKFTKRNNFSIMEKA